ncbi:MAG: d(CMP) kinase [Pseudomonadota bacterium]
MIFTVAIDGPAAAGKGTISRAVADRFGFAHLDTGLLYRAVGARVLAGEDAAAAAASLVPGDLEADGLRTPAVAAEASKVAAIPEVRRALTAFQRSFARREGGAVLDGRDICTVISPEAEVKIYVTASPEMRAERRFRELSEGGHDVTWDSVLQAVRERDTRDMGRADAPLKAAPDAAVLDTSAMDADAAIGAAVALVEAALADRTR